MKEEVDWIGPIVFMPSQSNNKCHRFRRGGHQLNGRDRTERSSELHVDRAYYSSRWSRHLNRISGRLFRIPDWTGSKRKEWVHCLNPREIPEAVRSGSNRPGRHVPPRVSPSRTRETPRPSSIKWNPGDGLLDSGRACDLRPQFVSAVNRSLCDSVLLLFPAILPQLLEFGLLGSITCRVSSCWVF